MSLRVSLVRMPLLSAFSNSGGTMLSRNALILELAEGGTQAFSECVTEETPSCTGEDNGTALRAIKTEFARELRADPPSPERFLDSVERVEGHQMAKAAVEMLLWDYHAKRNGVPLDEALGESRGYAEAGVAIGLGRDSEVVGRVEAALKRGYKRIKVKIDRAGASKTLGAIREAFPEIPLSADANACFELPRDMARLKRMDEFGLQYLEQPLGYDDLAGHARLAKEMSTPICLDESVTTVERATQALEIGAAKVINVKPGRVGGLTPAMEIARITRARRAHVWVGGMLETGVGRAFNVALASQRQFDYPGDTSPNDRYFERDLVKNPFKMRRGRVRPNPGKGSGIELDRDYLASVTLGSWKLF
ncbi:MAG TPA: o-succinylbenzoate synthase [Nitrososphaerales archaeon]|nr:o-succinylbenzoate synthase [Nitrososphaerales archaeon]